MKRFEDKYLQGGTPDKKSSPNHSEREYSYLNDGNSTPLQLKGGIHPKIIDFTYNLTKDRTLIAG